MAALRGKAHDMQSRDYWPTRTLHKTDLLQEQLETGLYSIKRYAFYFQKVVDLRRPVVIELRKVTDYEAKEKGSKISKDAMAEHVVNFSITQMITSQLFELELNFVQTIDRDVVQYILNWHRVAEKRLETLSKRLQQHYLKYKELLFRIIKSRTDCQKQWATLQGAWKDYEKCEQQKLTKKNGLRDSENAYKKYLKEVQKTHSQFNSFHTEIREANEAQTRHWTEELPAAVKEFEQLENDRLQTWGIACDVFRNAQVEYFVKSRDVALNLDSSTSTLDGELEMKNFADSLVKQFGMPVAPEVINDYLPCDYTRLQPGEDLQQLLSIDLSVALAQRQQAPASGITNRPSGFVAPSAVVPTWVKPQFAHAIGRALYDYPATDSDDLSMKEGDLVAILDMPPPTTEDCTWWIAARFDTNSGRLLQKGIIPSNYITIE